MIVVRKSRSERRKDEILIAVKEKIYGDHSEQKHMVALTEKKFWWLSLGSRHQGDHNSGEIMLIMTSEESR